MFMTFQSPLRYAMRLMLASVSAMFLYSYALPVAVRTATFGDIESVRGGASPPCQSSDHEFCPNDGNCDDQECDVVTLMCPDPDDPMKFDSYTTFNCNASDAVNVATQQWYQTCDTSDGFDGYRGSITGTADCGFAEDCYVEASSCYSTPVCTPVTSIDPNTGNPVTNYYCPGYNDSWDLPVDTCTPDSSQPICILVPRHPRFRGQTLAELVSSSGLVVRIP